MKKLFICLPVAVIIICGCMRKQDTKSDNEAGIILNPSAELTDGSAVKGWAADSRSRNTVLFYDNVAHEGSKSLFIDAASSSYGRWSTKVLLHPWSKYRFSGWMKTENIVSQNGNGAGFRIDGMTDDTKGLTGTNDWTPVSFEFETGNNDCAVISCLLDMKSRSKGRVWFDDMKLELVSTEKPETHVIIDVEKQADPMPAYIYGQFIEHLGRCIYGGIWAEMLEDRKFWYVPGTRESSWRINGEQSMLSMDTNDPYTGAQSVVLSSDGIKKAILVQENLGLKQNMTYTGNIILRGSGGLGSATITLSHGPGKSSPQTITINGITNRYAGYPISFRSDSLVHDAVLEIAPGGKGKLFIGTVSLMPDDNVEGFRSDVLTLLRQLNSPVYRWPGGNFVSGYNWRDGIGERDRRPPRKNPAWMGVESNDVGIHEFMRLCELINTEPYIAVNAGLGSSDEARAEVEYTNGGQDTPMGKLRSANGHPVPWKVKFWSIGNEMYGSWQLGHMSTEEFVKKNNDFSDKMRSVDHDIKLISVGDLGKWDEMILSNCSDKMDYISEHFYQGDNHGGGLMTHVNQIPDAIREKARAHMEYRNSIPALKGKDIKICMDEWNYWYGPHIYGELGTRYFFRDALGIAAGINEFSKHTDIIYMANYAQTVNVIGCIKTNTTDAVFDATGQALKLYRHRFGVIPVEITGDIRPLDIGATLTAGKDTLTVSVVNPTWDKIQFPLDIKGREAAHAGETWCLTAPDIMSTNEPGREEVVKIKGPVPFDFSDRIEVGPASVTIFRIPLN